MNDSVTQAILRCPDTDLDVADTFIRGAEGRERKHTAASKLWTEGRPCPRAPVALGKSVSEIDVGCHDGTGAGILRLTRLGEQGYQGVQRAIEALRGAFLNPVTAPVGGKRSALKAEAERKRWCFDCCVLAFVEEQTSSNGLIR